MVFKKDLLLTAGVVFAIAGAVAAATVPAEKPAQVIGKAGECTIYHLSDAKNDVYVAEGNTLHPCSVTTVKRD